MEFLPKSKSNVYSENILNLGLSEVKLINRAILKVLLTFQLFVCVLVAVSAVAAGESGFPRGVRNSPEDRREGMPQHTFPHPPNVKGIHSDDAFAPK